MSDLPYKVITATQRTPEWYKARRGRATASRFKDIIATAKTPKRDAEGNKYYPYLASRETYMRQLVVERIYGSSYERDVFITEAMKWGMMNEDVARTQYMLRTGNKVQEEGFVQHLTLMAGCSTDGFVNADGNLEIKSLVPENHIFEIFWAAMRVLNDPDGDYKDLLPEDYKAQVQGQLWITGREWCDFVGGDSRAPKGLDLYAVRVYRDDDYIAMLEQEVIKFLAEVDRMYRYFLRCLPTCSRICRNCGVTFIDKVYTCPDCDSNNTFADKTLAPAELDLLSLTMPPVAAKDTTHE
jgi:hypothetical protein